MADPAHRQAKNVPESAMYVPGNNLLTGPEPAVGIPVLSDNVSLPAWDWLNFLLDGLIYREALPGSLQQNKPV